MTEQDKPVNPQPQHSYMYVCNAGKNRSALAERLTWKAAKLRRKEGEIRVQHMGIAYPEETAEYEEQEARTLNSFKHIIAMTDEQAAILRTRYRVPDEKIRVWNIPDEYDIRKERHEAELTLVLLPRIKRLLDETL